MRALLYIALGATATIIIGAAYVLIPLVAGVYQASYK
jgi:hypothetical protein